MSNNTTSHCTNLLGCADQLMEKLQSLTEAYTNHEDVSGANQKIGGLIREIDGLISEMRGLHFYRERFKLQMEEVNKWAIRSIIVYLGWYIFGFIALRVFYQVPQDLLNEYALFLLSLSFILIVGGGALGFVFWMNNLARVFDPEGRRFF
jgi:uncharacterized protein YhbP (UPF0306 family)